MPEFKKDENELGALWVKSSPRGEFMSGTINGVPVVVFRNDKKAPGSKAPDWRVLVAQKKAPTAAADEDFPF